MKIYVVVDVDDNTVYVFINKINAIKFMYEKCNKWGAVLSIFKDGNYVGLTEIANTEKEKIDFLLRCSEKELNDVFYAYWYYKEVVPEDY